MRKKLLTTDSTLCGYIIMPVVCTLYGYQDSALNHMASDRQMCLHHVLLGPCLFKISKETLFSHRLQTANYLITKSVESDYYS